ncbi:MAG: sigma-70 family RNA polymerase sigma factor [Bacteroidetes bacterium]|nr:sigma-70 family RNA polymerase sigma factor [Bacteroidota bacterium]
MKEAEFIQQIKSNQGLIRKLAGLYASDPEDLKDLCQEVIYQAWKGIDSFRGDAKFSTWLYRLALNTIFSIKRKKNLVDYKDPSTYNHPIVDESATNRLQSEYLYKAIRQLSETDRAIISLHLDGYGNSEIADITGINANHVGVKLYRIKNELSQKLK